MTATQGSVATVHTASLHGIDGTVVEVEVDLARGLPVFTVVGLPDASVRESKERVRSAVKNADLEFPLRRITVNLAPADIRKVGPLFDLPIALGVLAASGQVPPAALAGTAAVGELALTGEVRAVHGVLPAALAVRAAGFRRLLLPAANAAEAAVVRGLEILPVRTLLETAEFLLGQGRLLPAPPPARAARRPARGAEGLPDFADVRGQEHAKRALEIAAAGGHNVLLLGPPGTGKTMLARRLPSILPALSDAEALEITKIHSVAGLLAGGTGLLRTRPFRAPHHTISDAGLVGGGTTPHLGEVSLAHLGVLFLDELPEFHRHVLEVLRQPLEDGRVSIVRAGYAVDYPARVSLVAAMNPCPCGNLTHPRKSCRCTPQDVRRYLAKISGPLLDRIDLHVEVPVVAWADLAGDGRAEASAAVARRVAAARRLQTRRLKGARVHTNAQMPAALVRRHCRLEPGAQDILRAAVESFGLSARGHDRLLKVARTIADLAGQEALAPAHVAEALQYRVLDRSVT